MTRIFSVFTNRGPLRHPYYLSPTDVQCVGVFTVHVTDLTLTVGTSLCHGNFVSLSRIGNSSSFNSKFRSGMVLESVQ